jgi:hypothetical protein
MSQMSGTPVKSAIAIFHHLRSGSMFRALFVRAVFVRSVDFRHQP